MRILRQVAATEVGIGVVGGIMMFCTCGNWGPVVVVGDVSLANCVFLFAPRVESYNGRWALIDHPPLCQTVSCSVQFRRSKSIRIYPRIADLDTQSKLARLPQSSFLMHCL